MADKFVLKCNDGLYHGDDGKNVATLAQWKEELVKWNKGELFVTGDGEEEWEEEEDGEQETVDIERLTRMLLEGSVQVFSQNMCEMGDDYVELELIQLCE